MRERKVVWPADSGGQIGEAAAALAHDALRFRDQLTGLLATVAAGVRERA
jgi:hypothetical protein